MSKTIYAVLGKKCGHTHYFEVELDIQKTFYMLNTGGEPVVRFREVELKGNSGVKIKRVIFDEYVEEEK